MNTKKSSFHWLAKVFSLLIAQVFLIESVLAGQAGHVFRTEKGPLDEVVPHRRTVHDTYHTSTGRSNSAQCSRSSLALQSHLQRSVKDKSVITFEACVKIVADLISEEVDEVTIESVTLTLQERGGRDAVVIGEIDGKSIVFVQAGSFWKRVASALFINRTSVAAVAVATAGILGLGVAAAFEVNLVSPAFLVGLAWIYFFCRNAFSPERDGKKASLSALVVTTIIGVMAIVCTQIFSFLDSEFLFAQALPHEYGHIFHYKSLGYSGYSIGLTDTLRDFHFWSTILPNTTKLVSDVYKAAVSFAVYPANSFEIVWLRIGGHVMDLTLAFLSVRIGIRLIRQAVSHVVDARFKLRDKFFGYVLGASIMLGYALMLFNYNYRAAGTKDLIWAASYLADYFSERPTDNDFVVAYAAIAVLNPLIALCYTVVVSTGVTLVGKLIKVFCSLRHVRIFLRGNRIDDFSHHEATLDISL